MSPNASAPASTTKPASCSDVTPQIFMCGTRWLVTSAVQADGREGANRLDGRGARHEDLANQDCVKTCQGGSLDVRGSAQARFGDAGDVLGQLGDNRCGVLRIDLERMQVALVD